jgi:hypothetical protein
MKLKRVIIKVHSPAEYVQRCVEICCEAVLRGPELRCTSNLSERELGLEPSIELCNYS